jgi:hypothetical protein
MKMKDNEAYTTWNGGMFRSQPLEAEATGAAVCARWVRQHAHQKWRRHSL